MSKRILAAAALAMGALISGCGGSGGAPATATVTGKAADGYLSSATVFLVRNGNYRLDAGEPATTSDEQGGFALEVPRGDLGRYPIVVMAVQGVTTDLDNPGQTIVSSYLMSVPASAVTDTAPCFVSPMSTLLREKMEARPGMTLAEAMAELRNQMNLPAGVNMMADYVRLGSAGSSASNSMFYDRMHGAARTLVSLMGGESARVMGMAGGAASVDVNRYRTMMGSLNLQLPEMMELPAAGRGREVVLMGMAGNVEAAVSAVAPMMNGAPFLNMSSMFPSMTGVPFWNMTGHLIPGSWMMGGRNGGGMMGGRNGGMMGS